MTSAPAKAITERTRHYRGRLEAALDEYTRFDSGCPEHLRSAVRYCLLNAGKRLRPVMVLMATEACGGQWERALPAACAVEMIHTYSLIHDDLPAMDDDQLRRGKPSCHVQYGEATAILAGDALLALAFDVLARDTQPPALAARCVAALAQAAGATALVGGQADDLQSDPARRELSLLESIHRRKTGAMIQVSLQLGGLVAQAGAEQLAALDDYGAKVGLAFQITDDLLDLRGEQAEVGKQLRKDSSCGKLTFPALMGVEASLKRAGQLVDEACARVGLLGSHAEGFVALAQYVLQRSR
jgi:geranylgeranyl diphosphate synthase type II